MKIKAKMIFWFGGSKGILASNMQLAASVQTFPQTALRANSYRANVRGMSYIQQSKAWVGNLQPVGQIQSAELFYPDHGVRSFSSVLPAGGFA